MSVSIRTLRSAVIWTAVLAAAPAVWWASAATPPSPAKPADKPAGNVAGNVIGRKVPAAPLADLKGGAADLADHKAHRVLVVAFLGCECPLARQYGPVLAKLATELAGRSVGFVGIDANAQDTPTEIAGYARLHGVGFPIYRDPSGRAAGVFGATRTPEVFVLDADRVIRYRGRVDDQYGIGFVRKKPTRRDLLAAVEEVLAGKLVSVPETDAPGCRIGRTRTARPDAAVTYNRDIAPVLNRRCVECHRPGDIGPFPLDNYSDAAAWADTIAEVVADERMPPWHAAAAHGKFSNDRRMSAEEKRLIAEWAAAGAPEGDPSVKPPAPPTFAAGWQLPRKPDLVLDISPRPFAVPASGAVRYQYFVVDPGFKEDKWLQAAEVLPGNRAVVHHVLVFARSGILPRGGGLDETKGYLAAYVPGLRAVPYPPGLAKRIPAGSKLIFQVHYTATGKPETDQSKIGLLFADPAQVTHEVRTVSTVGRRISIPPGAGDHAMDSPPITLPTDARLLALMPHMHVRGKAFRYEAVAPDGRTEILLDVPRYDFNWQTAYLVDGDKTLPAGTKVRATARFDNSDRNPNNPDPSATVRWGSQTWEEMMIGYFDIAVPRTTAAKYSDDDGEAPAEGAEVKVPKDGVAIPEQFARMLQRFDKNGDGRLDAGEIEAMPRPLRGRVHDYIRKHGLEGR